MRLSIPRNKKPNYNLQLLRRYILRYAKNFLVHTFSLCFVLSNVPDVGLQPLSKQTIVLGTSSGSAREVVQRLRGACWDLCSQVYWTYWDISCVVVRGQFGCIVEVLEGQTY